MQYSIGGSAHDQVPDEAAEEQETGRVEATLLKLR